MISKCIGFFFPALDPNRYAQFGVPRETFLRPASALAQSKGRVYSVAFGMLTIIAGAGSRSFEVIAVGAAIGVSGVLAAGSKGIRVIHLIENNPEEAEGAQVIISRRAGGVGMVAGGVIGLGTDVALKLSASQGPNAFTLLAVVASSVAGYVTGRVIVSSVAVTDAVDHALEQLQPVVPYQELRVVVNGEGVEPAANG